MTPPWVVNNLVHPVDLLLHIPVLSALSSSQAPLVRPRFPGQPESPWSSELGLMERSNNPLTLSPPLPFDPEVLWVLNSTLVCQPFDSSVDFWSFSCASSLHPPFRPGPSGPSSLRLHYCPQSPQVHFSPPFPQLRLSFHLSLSIHWLHYGPPSLRLLHGHPLCWFHRGLPSHRLLHWGLQLHRGHYLHRPHYGPSSTSSFIVVSSSTGHHFHCSHHDLFLPDSSMKVSSSTMVSSSTVVMSSASRYTVYHRDSLLPASSCQSSR